MAAANMLTYIQTLLDQGRFRNNPMADRLPPSMVPPGQVWTPNPAEIERMQAMGRPAPAPSSSAGLPDAVVRSIQQQPSYGEGQPNPFRRVPGQLPFDTLMNRELSLGDSSRTGGDRLYNELGSWRDFLTLDQPLPEGMRPYTDQFRGQPIYPSPLNSLMGRLPGMGLY